MLSHIKPFRLRRVVQMLEVYKIQYVRLFNNLSIRFLSITYYYEYLYCAYIRDLIVVVHMYDVADNKRAESTAVNV
jgi:hypothetical protein